MPPPPIQLFMTTIASQPALRQRQETLLRVLQVKKIPFTSYDLASDEEAKKLWRRKVPTDKQLLPGMLIGGEFPGTYAEFEDAVEYGELDIFLRRNEDWKPSEFDRPAPQVKPVGVPGAYSPNEMNPKHRPSLSPSPSASPLKGKGKVVKTNDELGEYGIHDVELTEDDLTALVEELGLGEADASDLVKGLAGIDSKSTPKITVEKPDEEKAAAAGTTKEQSNAKEDETEVVQVVEDKKLKEEAQKEETKEVVKAEETAKVDIAEHLEKEESKEESTEVKAPPKTSKAQEKSE